LIRAGFPYWQMAPTQALLKPQPWRMQSKTGSMQSLFWPWQGEPPSVEPPELLLEPPKPVSGKLNWNPESTGGGGVLESSPGGTPPSSPAGPASSPGAPLLVPDELEPYPLEPPLLEPPELPEPPDPPELEPELEPDPPPSGSKPCSPGTPLAVQARPSVANNPRSTPVCFTGLQCPENTSG
jgi:hypothetical protein